MNVWTVSSSIPTTRFIFNFLKPKKIVVKEREKDCCFEIFEWSWICWWQYVNNFWTNWRKRCWDFRRYHSPRARRDRVFFNKCRHTISRITLRYPYTCLRARVLLARYKPPWRATSSEYTYLNGDIRKHTRKGQLQYREIVTTIIEKLASLQSVLSTVEEKVKASWALFWKWLTQQRSTGDIFGKLINWKGWQCKGEAAVTKPYV